MKTGSKTFRCSCRGRWLGTVVLTFALAGAPVVADSTTPPKTHPDPFQKGATRLMDHPKPEPLPSELECPVLGCLHTNWHLLSDQLVRYQTVRSNHPVRIAIHVMNDKPNRPVLVLVHGILSDHITWEYITPQLVTNCEVWLVDLPGCGESDAPDPSTLEPDGYSPTAMAERVLQALEQRLAAEPAVPARSLVLVGHSLGGTVCIRMLSAPELREDYAAVVNRVESMVLFAPSDLAINAVPPSFVTLLDLKGWMVDVAKALGVWDSKLRDLIKDGYVRPECATAEQQEHFDHVLNNARHRKAAIAMLRQFTPFDPKTMRPVWAAIDALVADYENISVPVLIAHGTWDETLPTAMGHKLKDQIPGAWLVEIPRSGHSLPTERPVQCAALIEQFVAQSHVRVPAGSGGRVYPPLPPTLPGLVGTQLHRE